MHGASILLVFGFLASVSQALVCPSPFKNILGVCLHFQNKLMTWCDAQAYCWSLRGELVRGSDYLPLSGKTFSGIPRHYWIGLTDFLYERIYHRDGWRWTNGTVAKTSNLIWESSTEPGNIGRIGKQDCVMQCKSTGKLCDADCLNVGNLPIVPMCQQRSVPNSAKRVSNYEITSIPVGLHVYDYAHGPCTRLISAIVSRIQCATLCNNEPGDWCVAFYFNQGTKECQIVLYTDANVYKSDAKDWIKQTKTRD